MLTAGDSSLVHHSFISEQSAQSSISRTAVGECRAGPADAAQVCYCHCQSVRDNPSPSPGFLCIPDLWSAWAPTHHRILGILFYLYPVIDLKSVDWIFWISTLTCLLSSCPWRIHTRRGGEHKMTLRITPLDHCLLTPPFTLTHASSLLLTETVCFLPRLGILI